MIDIFLAPRHYMQREGVLSELGRYTKPYSQHPLILGDALVFSIVQSVLTEGLSEVGLSPVFVLFEEECSQKEVQRVIQIAEKEEADCIIGVGGGKAIDTSRLVADRLHYPLITLPTSAATCSAASSMAVIYEKGVRQANITGKGADLVLVDPSIISRAPARLLAAGMGDALAKWYEGKPTYDRLDGYDSTIESAMNLSIQIKEAIFKFGLEAKRDVDHHRNSKAVEAIIEANILLTGVVSGLGGSRFRAAVAHALLYGLTIHPEIHRYLHGEIVAFGIIVQLCLEKNRQGLEEIVPFFSELGLPLSLKELGIENVRDPILWEGLRRACAKESTVHNMPFPVNPQTLYGALLEAEQRAKTFKQGCPSGY